MSRTVAIFRYLMMASIATAGDTVFRPPPEIKKRLTSQFNCEIMSIVNEGGSDTALSGTRKCWPIRAGKNSLSIETTFRVIPDYSGLFRIFLQIFFVHWSKRDRLSSVALAKEDSALQKNGNTIPTHSHFLK
jgi:hypothetical protein